MNAIDHQSLVLRTNTTLTDFYGGCECAVLDVTSELVSLVRKRVEAAMSAGQEDPSLWELSYSSPDPAFYDCPLVTACNGADANFAAVYEEEGKACLPAEVAVENFEAEVTVCEEMVVRLVDSAHGAKAEVVWRVMPKHTETFVTTEAVTIKELEQYLQKGEPIVT